MATVKFIEYEEAGPEVREVYDDIMATRQIDLLSCGQKLLAIGIGRSLAAPPSHTTRRTGPYRAVRLIRQNQIQGNKSPSDVK